MTTAKSLHNSDIPQGSVKIKQLHLSIAIAIESQLAYYALVKMLDRVGSVRSTAPWSSTTTLPDVLIIGCGANDDLATVSHVAGTARQRDVKVLLLLLHESKSQIISEIATIPADGFLTEENITVEVLASALSGVQRGDLPIPESLVGRLLRTVRDGAGPNGTKIRLTARERQTLQYLVDGLGNKQIAVRMQISIHGVKRLVANVFAKLDCSNRTEAAAIAIRDKLLYP